VQPIAYEVSLDTVDKPELPLVSAKKRPAKATDLDGEDEATPTDVPDEERTEALNILGDLSSMTHSLRTAGNVTQAAK